MDEKARKESWLSRFVRRLAEASDREFGSTPPSCCGGNHRSAGGRAGGHHSDDGARDEDA